MKLIRYLHGDRPRYAVVEEELAYPIDSEPWEGAIPVARGIPTFDLRLLPPCTPSKIVGIGKNYRTHAKEMGAHDLPEEPLLFLKPPSALIATGEPIVRPRGYERVDFEGELGVVIGRPAHRIKPNQALEVVLGYTCINDITVRDLQRKDVQFTRAKSFDTFAPLGPCITTGVDPRTLRLQTRLNGAVRQDAPITDLVFDVPHLVWFVAQVMTLLPGDVIATGTPAGVGNLAPGDVVDVEIAEIGTLHNPVISPE